MNYSKHIYLIWFDVIDYSVWPFDDFSYLRRIEFTLASIPANMTAQMDMYARLRCRGVSERASVKDCPAIRSIHLADKFKSGTCKSLS